MPSFLLLESGDKLLLESGDGLLLEDLEQTISLPLVDDSAIYGPALSLAGAIFLPLIDDSSVMGPAVTGTVTVSLPLLDTSAVLAPEVATGQQANLPLLDGGVVYAPTLVWDQWLTMPLVDGGVAFGPIISREGDEGVTLTVDGVEYPATARAFEEQLAETGMFSFRMARDAFLASGIDYEQEVAFTVDGQQRFWGIVEEIDHTVLAPGEEIDHVVTVDGRGGLAEFDFPKVVYPSRGVGALPIEDVRSYSWVSVDYSATADDWPHPKTVNFVSNYAGSGTRRPNLFPNINGRFIWGDVPGVTSTDAPQGINLFRQVLTLGATKTVRFFFAGDNVMRIWIDAAEMVWFAGSAIPRYVDLELSAGGHVIAAKVANKIDVPGEDNPAGFILAAYTLDQDGLLDELVLETDGDWRTLPYPVRAPGFTAGKVLRLILAESGLDGEWSRDFTDTLDSNGEAWTYQREINLDVGRKPLEAFRELMAYHCDIAVAPGGKVLRAWNRGTRGTVRAGAFQQTSDPATSDFLALGHEGKRASFNTALIRYAEGHTEYETGAGDRGGYLELGHVTDEGVAKEIAAALMEIRANPSYSTTATIHHPHSDAVTPFKGFGVGDWKDLPNEVDDVESMRCYSVRWAEDDDGVVDYPVTFRNRVVELEERNAASLQRMADGIGVAGARVASRADAPTPSAQQVTVLKVAEFSHDNIKLTHGYSPIRPADQSGNIVEVFAELTNPDTMTGDAIVQVRIGTAGDITGGVLAGSLLATVTIPQGRREASVPIDIVPAYADRSKLQTRIVDGGEAEGLDVQVRGI